MKLLALAGGVGGAKLASGLAESLPPDDLTIVVNTADDFEHFGLYICPDLDTVCYSLAGLADRSTGWGRADETWQALTNVARLGGPVWFRLGDQDLATHLERTRRLKEGQSLSEVVRSFCQAWGIKQRILPMADQPIRTVVRTANSGDLAFQDYFVRLASHPRVTGFSFSGIESATMPEDVAQAIAEASHVVICPSNPWVSIAPILAVPGIRPKLQGKKVVAVSPIIGGRTVRGPAAKMYEEMGMLPSALAVAEHYRGLATHFVLDHRDSNLEPDVRRLTMYTLVTDTVMQDPQGRKRLAEDVLNFVGLPT